MRGRPSCLLQSAGGEANRILLASASSATSNNTKFGTLAVDGWAVTFGTARRGLGGLRPRPVPSSLYQM